MPIGTTVETETWTINISFDMRNCPAYFPNNEPSDEFLIKSQTALSYEIERVFAIIVNAVLFSDPNKDKFDDIDFEKILGNLKRFTVESIEGEVSFDLSSIKNLAQKYFEKAKNKWSNAQIYWPSYHLNNDSSEKKSTKMESLFSFFYEINKSLTMLNNGRIDKFCLFNKKIEKYDDHDLFEQLCNEFAVKFSKDHTHLLLNLEDYLYLEMGIVRSDGFCGSKISFDILEKKVSNIFPSESIKSGYARLIDTRSFKICPHKELTDIESFCEGSKCTFQITFGFDISMSDNFVGCLFRPWHEEINNNKDNMGPQNKEIYSWIDEKLNNDFKFKAEPDPNSDFYIGSEQLVLWYLKSLKDEGKTKEEICKILSKIFQEVSGDFPKGNSEAWCGYNPSDYSVKKLFVAIAKDLGGKKIENILEKIKKKL